MNYVDAYYKTMDTRIVVTNVIVWNKKNAIPVTTNAKETLEGNILPIFLSVRKVKSY